jgi:two-component system, chemotaxis family, CheB/CheR fusion protein
MPGKHAFSQLVVIGASAGGIEALSTLVSTLPRDLPAPIVIAQHLDPALPSRLGSILTRNSTLPVRTVTERTPLEPGVVFVVPSNRDVEITDHEARLRADTAGRSRPSVDLLLSSAAQAYGDDLIAVILTGSGSDGTAGARAVKAAGGTVVIQTPQTARFPAMPQSLAPTTVDITANLEDMGSVLQALLADAATPQEPTEMTEKEEETLRALLAQVQARQGIDFTHYKTPTIRRRLQRRMVATGTDTLATYSAYVQSHPVEYERLTSSFLIKVTEFYRDPELFAYLRTQVLPELIAQARTRGNELRLWSAGCATGEEAYSLAILVADVLGDELERFTVRIFATDLDPTAIAFARRGVYPAAALASLPDDLIAPYFTPVDGAYALSKRVRGVVVFGQHDLGQRPPFPRIDLCMCRNVLIYFTADLQQRALRLFAFALRDDGLLVLGKAETTSTLPASFVSLDPHLKIYRRHGGRLLILPPETWDTIPASPTPVGLHGPALVEPAGTPQSPPDPQLFSTPEEDILSQLPVGVVVVDRRYDIQTINSAAQRLLSIYGAALREDLIHLAQTVPAAPLRAAIDAAFEGAAPSSIDEVVTVDPATAEERYIQITCYPRTGAQEDEPVAAVMIVVADITRLVHERHEREQAYARQREEMEHERDALEQAHTRQREETARVEATLRQVTDSNRQLLAANQTLGATNKGLRHDNVTALVGTEEAQAATEEAIALNEESQATNEELETLNEELQATIEELHTTNRELEARTGELRELAAALEAKRAQLAVILASIGDAVLLVDPTGAIVRTNAAYAQMFGSAHAAFVPEDEHGQPLPPEATPHSRAARGETFSMQFSLTTGEGARRWFEANGQPLRGNDEEHSVVVIREITASSLHRRLQDEFLALASHELRTPLTAVQGSLELLLNQLPAESSDARPRHSASLALRHARRLAVLVRDLTDVVRLQSGKLVLTCQAVDLVALVTQVVEDVQVLAQGRTVHLDAGTGPLLVYGDAGRLEQVLLNLLTNALAHAPEASRIEVRLRRVDDEVELQVQDYGRGVAAAALPHLFTRFYQVARPDRPSQGGLGLGLFICQELVTAHGGRIDVRSTEGEGTTFTVWLPLLDSGADPRDRPDDVLVVRDEAASSTS